MVSTSAARLCIESGRKPDIAVAFRAGDATGANIERVIEVKHVRTLGAAPVREQFGKAFDLNVLNYCLLTYYCISPDIRVGANKLGLDVAGLFIAPGMTPVELVSHVCATLEQSRKNKRFTTSVKTGYDRYQLCR